MEVDKIIINFRKKKEGCMKGKIKVVKEGNRVVPRLKKVTTQAIKSVKKTYPK